MSNHVTSEYVAELCRRIENGETPKKNTEISDKDFARQMLPHIKNFLAKGYTYKEIADFFGHISATDLKKAVAKELPEKQNKQDQQDKPEKPVKPEKLENKDKKAEKPEAEKKEVKKAPAKPVSKSIPVKKATIKKPPVTA